MDFYSARALLSAVKIASTCDDFVHDCQTRYV